MKLSGLVKLALLLLGVIAITQIPPLIHQNMAYLRLMHVMSADNIDATKRQAGLLFFADYLCSRKGIDCSSRIPSDGLSEDSMLRAIFTGEYYRIQGDIAQAAQWYWLASQCTPYPLIQDSLAYVSRDRLLPDGSLLMDDFSNLDKWQLDRVNSNVSNVILQSDGAVAWIAYQNRFEERDILAYYFYPEWGVLLGYHTVLSVRVKVDPGSFLTLEAKVDDVLERYLNYYEGSEDWETLRFPLGGDKLQMIKLILSESGKDSRKVAVHKINFDWIRLELELTKNEDLYH